MKTVCVVVVALSLISVCCSAPLACDKLLKPIEGLPDVTGRWYFIGMTTSFCLPTSLLNAILWPSITMDYVSKGTPDIYNVTVNINENGFCHNQTFPNLVKSNYISEVDKNDAPSGDRLFHLFQTGCPDCYVALENTGFFRYMVIASRRKTLTAAELEEFEMQASCHDLTKPQYMNTDFDAPGRYRVELLQTSCPDCFVALENSSLVRYMVIASRRKTLTAAELEEFEMQAKCLDLSKPQYIDTDFDFENCRTPDTTTHEELFAEIRERAKSMGHRLFKCMIEAFLYFNPNSNHWLK